MVDNLTIGDWLARGMERLAGAGTERGAAWIEAETLLAAAVPTTRTRIKSHPETLPDAQATQRFAQFLERRLSGEPVAYITGLREFWSLPLRVCRDVLVPRPETELLVERALAVGPVGAGDALELGTGSGAVAVALARERPNWRITAVDISAAALVVARTNALALAGHVEFVLGSWLECLPGRRFHLIAANPPYVADTDPLLEGDLRYEPRIALAAGADGLACLHDIIRSSPAHLLPGGWLLLEHAADQALRVRDALVGRGFASVRSHRDLAGHERVTEGRCA